jgi:hypothetical protein
MSNDYYNRTFDVLPGNRVGSQRIEDELLTIAQGFDKLPDKASQWGAKANFYADTGGAANAFAFTPNSNLTALADGQTFRLRAAHNTTGASTLTVTGLAAALAIVRPDGTATQANDILAGQVFQVTYNATAGNFMLDLGGGAAVTAANGAAASASAAAASASAAAASKAGAASSAADAQASAAAAQGYAASLGNVNKRIHFFQG